VGGHTLLRLSVCEIRGRVIMMSQYIDTFVQEFCEGGISYFAVDKQGVLTCISVLKELCNRGSA
jgi:hypothetical protein